MYKIICFFFILITLHCSKYHLVIYQAMDCPYCKFATQQIKSIISEHHLGNTLKLTVVDCDTTINLCRDSQNKPLLVITTSKGQKIKQIGGVHSKLYFRDWILDVVDRNPMRLEDVAPAGKYKRKTVANKQQVVQFFNKYVERQAKIENDKLNIFVQAYKHINYTQPQSFDFEEQIFSAGNFRFDLRSLALSCIPVISIVFMLALRKCQSNRRTRNSIRIPTNQEEEN